MSRAKRRNRKQSARQWYFVLAIIGLVVLVGGLFVGVVSAPAPSPTPTPGVPAVEVPRIEVKPAREALAAGSAVMVDARSAEQYAQSHIAGAISIPLTETAERATELPKDKDIIFY